MKSKFDDFIFWIKKNTTFVSIIGSIILFVPIITFTIIFSTKEKDKDPLTFINIVINDSDIDLNYQVNMNQDKNLLQGLNSWQVEDNDLVFSFDSNNSLTMVTYETNPYGTTKDDWQLKIASSEKENINLETYIFDNSMNQINSYQFTYQGD